MLKNVPNGSMVGLVLTIIVVYKQRRDQAVGAIARRVIRAAWLAIQKLLLTSQYGRLPQSFGLLDVFRGYQVGTRGPKCLEGLVENSTNPSI